MTKLFSSKLKVINVGLSSFADDLRRCGHSVVEVDWKPPVLLSGGSLQTLESHREQIEKANKLALDKILAGKPMLIRMGTAEAVIPGMKKDLILHAGPPVTWERMCGPMRGAVIGALIYERIAKDPEEAEAIARSGKIKFEPCHEHNSVGPMAGIISASMPVFVVQNTEFGNYSYCTMNEGLGKVLRYGAYGDEVIERLRWMESTLYPVLNDALKSAGPIDLKMIIAQALHMGDEVHNRNRAGTSLFYRAIAPGIVRTAKDPSQAAEVLEFINRNDHFFLNLSMAASKAVLDPAKGTPNSSLVNVMARNGTDFGVQVAGLPNVWFTGEAPVPDALFFPGYSKNDANPDIGDSAITETGGLGGFAIAASPAIVQFVGGSAADAVGYTQQMYEITVGENNVYQIPGLDFRGTPTGIDCIKIVEKGIFPFIDTGVAHKKPGVGQVGAGVLSAPAEPFRKAVEALAAKISVEEKK